MSKFKEQQINSPQLHFASDQSEKASCLRVDKLCSAEREVDLEVLENEEVKPTKSGP